MKIKVHLVKAFTQDSKQGNPAGIIVDCNDLSQQQMINISSKYNFSECAFIETINKKKFKTRFFSPKQEVDFCGHATVAAFNLITDSIKEDFQNFEKISLTQETKIGSRPVHCYKNGFIEMEQSEPRVIDFKIDYNEIARLLSINKSDICFTPQIVSTGSPKLIVLVKDLETLLKIKPDFDGIKQYCIESGARGFYPFTNQTINKNSDFHARQFNPLAGINEDPITGVAAGALGVYVTQNKIVNKNKLTIEQGYIIGKYGEMHVDLSDTVRVGGHAIKFGEDEIDI